VVNKLKNEYDVRDMDHRRLIKLLKERGSDLKKPHAVEFYVYLPTKALANKLARKIRKEGFEVQVLSDPSGARWLCLPIKNIVPNARTLASIQKHFNTLAQPHGGKCDGWGTQVEK
jgi:regulator of RNase E activity RraB